MSEPVMTRIAITPDEWAALRKACIDSDVRPSQLLAELVRKYLKGRK
jgi:hypothetical protein